MLEHAHHNEQITYITQGALQFKLGEDGEREVVVHAGEVLVIPSNTPHSAHALEDTIDIDIFSPPRETGSTAPTHTCAATAADHN